MGKLTSQNIDTNSFTDTLPEGFNKVNETHRLLESITAGEGASIIGFDNTGNISSSNVQAAIVELDAQDITLQSNIDDKEGWLGYASATYILQGNRAWVDPNSLFTPGGKVDSVNGDSSINVILKASDIGRSTTTELSSNNVQAALAEIYAEKEKKLPLNNTGAYGYVLASDTSNNYWWTAQNPGGVGGVVDSVNAISTPDVVIYGTNIEVSSTDSTTIDTALDDKSTEAYALTSEHTPAGVLVYPSNEAQAITYKTDSTVQDYKTTYDGKNWTLAMTTYNNGNIELMTADNGAGSSWTRSISYSNGQVSNFGDWTV